jgi:hypothetical protein
VTYGAIWAGIGALITAGLGLALVIRELRRRERMASVHQISALADELLTHQRAVLTYQQWAFMVTQTMLEHGIQPPVLPEIHLAPKPPSEPETKQTRRQKRRE